MKAESLRPGDHVNAQMGTMPATDRQLYEAALQKMTVVTIPAAMDPRKGGGQA